MKKVLFIDRDGTLVVEPPIDLQLDSLEKLEFYPGVFQYLARIAKELEYELVMVSNQDGLGTESFPEETFWPAQNKIIQAFKNEGVEFDEILIDKSLPADQAPTRKPGTAMLTHYLKGNYDLANSFVIGDRKTDIELAVNLGCQSIFIGDAENEANFSSKSWAEIYQWLKEKPRTSLISRKTSETQIEIKLNLDGSGKSEINTGLSFFDHMLDQLARHGNFDLMINAKGDLQVDEHHTIEDVAITLGEAFNKALGQKKGIERYGFLLPMDDSLAQVALDFGGRSWLVWNAEFKREKIGDMPTEMFEHFFQSFCQNARCNLNIKAEGKNEHHKIESIFKAFAKALKNGLRTNKQFSNPKYERKSMIAIIKYNAGNIRSVQNALNRLGYESKVTDDLEEIRSAEKVIFPGVGEASSAMKYLRERGLDACIKSLTQPVLAICLGLQLLCEYSEEGNTECMGIFNATVKAFPPRDIVPHMGWNNFTALSGLLFDGVRKTDDVYFVHTFYATITEDTVAESRYILPFSSAMNKNNFYATQFHPEKSADVGEQILKNFLKL